MGYIKAIVRKTLAVLVVAVFLAPPAFAGLFGPNEIEKTLAADEVAVDGYTLARDDLNEFYKARDYRYAWDFGKAGQGDTVAAFLNSVEAMIDYHGLERDAYALPLFHSLVAAGDLQANSLKLELLATDTFLRLARDLHGDDIDLDELYLGWKFARDDIDIPQKLAAAVATNQLSDFISGLVPKNPVYGELAKALHDYNAIAASGGWPTIDEGQSLQMNDRGKRVGQLRARLAAENYLPRQNAPSKGARVFDEPLRNALMDYQQRNGLEGIGRVGKKTLLALNVPVETRIGQIRANMERLRHMPDDFPSDRYALVNIPAMSLTITEEGQMRYAGPVVVGRVDRKTPFIQSAIRSVIVNPIWHVPLKIARKDILPKLKEDPHYLEKLGFVISGSDKDPTGKSIDWASMPEEEFNFHLRQSPGERNSLGRLKFDFDNAFAVYMHGTPHQETFGKDIRAESSGCVRLRDPAEVAQILLAHNKDPWDLDRINAEIEASKTHWIPIAKPLPLFIVYWTVFMDEVGKLNFRDDIYSYDNLLVQAMKPGADIDTLAHPPENNESSRPH